MGVVLFMLSVYGVLIRGRIRGLHDNNGFHCVARRGSTGAGVCVSFVFSQFGFFGAECYVFSSFNVSDGAKF